MTDEPDDRAADPPHDPFAALRNPNFRWYWIGNFLALLGMQMQFAAVLWEINSRTKSAYALGLVGLVQVIPIVALALIAGHVADRFNRKHIVMLSGLIIALAAAGLAGVRLIADERWAIIAMFVLLFITGLARAFQQPAKSSLMPLLVSRENFTNAVTWSAMAFQLASVAGPALGGLLIARLGSTEPIYLLHAALAFSMCGMLAAVHYRRAETAPQPMSLENLLVGVNFMRRNRVILAAITMDLFAVLLGGAVSLLPMYADQILKVDAYGYGLLRAAPAIGALAMSLVMAKLPPMQHAGRNLLIAVTGFGIATIAFGFSRSFPFSLAMLFLTGAFDNISVVVRHSLVQLLAPDAMRGRISAVNGVFISISNEIGDFEAGMVAGLISPVFSVVSGGIGTLVVVAMSAWKFPELRRYGRLDAAAEETIQTSHTEAEGIEPAADRSGRGDAPPQG